MEPTDPTRHLGRNVRDRRRARGWTQRQLAEHAGLPRPTITRLESGSANPTVAVVAKVATALDASIEELLALPGAGERVVRAHALPSRTKRGVLLRQVLPRPLAGVVLERMAFPSGARLTGAPHGAGSQEYLVCESGRVTLRTVGERFDLGPGDVAVYDGDQPHSYSNNGDGPAVAYTVVVSVSEES